MVCKTEGFGVKKKGDPHKRWCGDDYNHMMKMVRRVIMIGMIENTTVYNI